MMKSSIRISAAALGVVLLSHPAPVAAQLEVSDVAVGAHWGFDFSDGAVEDERLGVGVTVPFYGPVEAVAEFSWIYDFLDAPDPIDIFAWEAYATVRVRPFGRGTFLALGYGLTYARVSISESITGMSESNSDWTDVGVIAVEWPRGRIRPFGELYLIDLLERQAAVGGHALFGINVVLD